ncbi:response regulator transcription factor [Gordonia insulae]|nr:helix-turn-helix transcriptional regulator [Gordonia insulae]
MDASDHDSLAQVFCQAMAAITGSESVALAEIDDVTIHELARVERPGAPSLLSNDRLTVGLAPRASTSVTWHQAAGANTPGQGTVTIVDLPSDGTRTVVFIDGQVDQDDRESVLLLVDIAGATAERIAGAERLRDQDNRFRSLSERIKALGNNDPEDIHDDRAAEFASTAALLTERERDILEDLLRGASNAAIAETHTLSIETVKTHVKHILRKMGANNRAELIARSG